MPGHGPCGIGQLNVSVDGSSASYAPVSLVVTVVSSRQLWSRMPTGMPWIGRA